MFAVLFCSNGIETNLACAYFERAMYFQFPIIIFNRCLHQLEPMPLGTSVKLPCSSVLKGQHLRIQLNGQTALTLCEVKAFTPDPGNIFM